MTRITLLATAAVLAALPAMAQTQQQRGQAAQGQNTQSGVPEAQSPTTPRATGSRAEVTTTPEFIRMASMSDRFELASSRLAEQRSTNARLKEFAQHMIRDHEKTTQELQRLTSAMPGQTGASAAPRGTGPSSPGPGASGSSAAGTSSSMAPAESGPRRGQGATTASQARPQTTGLDQQHTALLQQLEQAQGAAFDRLYARQQVQAHMQAVDLFRNYGRAGDNAELKRWASATLPSLEEHLRLAQQLRTGS
jgi:putative membrane protein